MSEQAESAAGEGERLYTRRQWLTRAAILDVGPGGGWLLVREAVSSVAIEHPEWDMDETRTWAEWEQEP